MELINRIKKVYQANEKLQTLLEENRDELEKIDPKIHEQLDYVSSLLIDALDE